MYWSSETLPMVSKSMSSCCPSETLRTIRPMRLTKNGSMACSMPSATAIASNAMASIASPALIAVGKSYSMWTAFRPRRMSSSSMMSSWTSVKLCMVSIAAPTSSKPACVSPTAFATIHGMHARSRLPPPSTKCIIAPDKRGWEVWVSARSILASTSGFTSAREVIRSAPCASGNM